MFFFLLIFFAGEIWGILGKLEQTAAKKNSELLEASSQLFFFTASQPGKTRGKKKSVEKSKP